MIFQAIRFSSNALYNKFIRGKKYFFILMSLVFIPDFMAQPCKAMETKKEYDFKRKYQASSYELDDQVEPALKKARYHSSSAIRRLSTAEDHQAHLQDAIMSATRSILITSHGIDHKAFKDGNLYSLLADAAERGVRVYLYNIDAKNTDAQTSKFFQEHGIIYNVTYTHAKILAIDDNMVAIGSYNWLSKANTWENATLCLSGQECSELIPLLWEDLKYYRNRQFGNTRQLRQYESNLENKKMDSWNLDRSTTLNYLHSLASHRDFIAKALQRAQTNLIFCTPFIQEKSGYQEDFSKELLRNAFRKNVHVYFVCRPEDPNLVSFRHYLGSLLESPFMHLVPFSNIHLKTVVIDDTTIAEGSFNWLSASRSEESDFHNHEVTLMIMGNGSKRFIQDFYASPVGQKVLEERQIQKGQQCKTRLLQKDNNRQRYNNTAHTYASHHQVVCPTPLQQEHWLALNWKVSKRGNSYLNILSADGNSSSHNIVITRDQEGAYSAIIDSISLNDWYSSEDQAKLAAFDFYLYLVNN